MQILEKIINKLDIVSIDGCWNFCGSISDGYGLIRNEQGKTSRAHRLLFFLWHDLDCEDSSQFVCHKCDNRRCCNPDHLYLGDAESNNRDCLLRKRHYFKELKFCKRGHEFNDENTQFFIGKNGKTWRYCRACKRIKSRRNK